LALSQDSVGGGRAEKLIPLRQKQHLVVTHVRGQLVDRRRVEAIVRRQADWVEPEFGFRLAAYERAVERPPFSTKNVRP